MTKLVQLDKCDKSGIVLVGGCFDLIHFGHIEFLRQAKMCGNRLIVLLESDENVRRMKGPTRPIHTQTQRKSMLEAVTFVNDVIPLSPMHSDQDYIDIVLQIKPAVIAITEGDPVRDKKQLQANRIGATLVVIPKIHTPSTSQLAKLLELE